jgi:diguanylate cyclase (GGDEF)-like protein
MDTLGIELRRLGIDCLIAQVDDSLKEFSVRYITIAPALIKKMEKITGASKQSYRIKMAEGSIFDNIARSRQGIFLNNPMDIGHAFLTQWPETLAKGIIKLAGVSEQDRVICLPMMIADKLNGFLLMWGNDLQSADLPAAMVFTSQVAIALENARLYIEVQKQAITDELTGLYNRRGLFEFGNREVERAHRFQRPLSALMLDIDHFKLVNDQYGHQAGDAVLETLAKRCRKNIRGIDIPGRYGGEEFLFLLVEDDIEEASQVAERLRTCFVNVPITTQAGDILITVSIGVAAASLETQDLAALIGRADEALYQAKKAGRNCVRVYSGKG